MSRRSAQFAGRPPHIALAAIAVLVSLGSVSEVKAAAEFVVARGVREIHMSTSDKQVVASLLSYLTEAARQFRPDQQTSAAAMALCGSSLSDAVFCTPCSGRVCTPAVLLAHVCDADLHLINLPPPAAC